MGPKPGQTATRELRLNSRQVQTGPQFQAGPDWASIHCALLLREFPFMRGLRAAGLHPFTPSPWVCGLRLHPFTPSPGGCGASPLHPFTRGLRASALHPAVAGFTPSPLHPGFAGCGASPLHPGFAGCGASPLHLGLGASRTQISEFSGSGIGGGHSGHVAAV